MPLFAVYLSRKPDYSASTGTETVFGAELCGAYYYSVTSNHCIRKAQTSMCSHTAVAGYCHPAVAPTMQPGALYFINTHTPSGVPGG